eukprot:Hpha_TRINITY_DN14967_c1_g1::TRINITY_DN14967_c1_g1_i2::g.143267::m.143267/K04373/RPS6KA; ribosomal protein S6 kinase alpha-1/2/3/6
MAGLLLFARVSPELAGGKASESLVAVELDPGGTVRDIILDLKRSGALSSGAHVKVEWQGVTLQPHQYLADAGLCPESVVLISRGVKTDWPIWQRQADFDREYVLGKSSFFGTKVYKVVSKSTKVEYAMKSKVRGLEMDLMMRINHPFITRIHYIFAYKRDTYNILMDFVPGGEVGYQLSHVGTFTEERSKFYAAQIASALDYLHNLGIVYQHLKLDSCLLDMDGYCVLTSPNCFLEPDRLSTPGGVLSVAEYLAPEVVKGSAEANDKRTDWWSLGIILYEMICRMVPFYSESVYETYDLILKKELTFEDKEDGDFWSEAAKGICTRLLERNPNERLHSLAEIKAHPFYEGWDWELMVRRGMTAPFRPDPASPSDRFRDYGCDSVFDDEADFDSEPGDFATFSYDGRGS